MFLKNTQGISASYSFYYMKRGKKILALFKILPKNCKLFSCVWSCLSIGGGRIIDREWVVRVGLLSCCRCGGRDEEVHDTGGGRKNQWEEAIDQIPRKQRRNCFSFPAPFFLFSSFLFWLGIRGYFLILFLARFMNLMKHFNS